MFSNERYYVYVTNICVYRAISIIIIILFVFTTFICLRCLWRDSDKQ